MIELEHIFKEFDNDGSITPVLNDIELRVDQGSFVALMGPSGSGKSTLMNIMGFLDTVTKGIYRFKGADVSSLSEVQLAEYRSSEIGFVFQAFNLLPKTSVLANVELPLLYAAKRRSDKERKQVALQAIESVGLSHRAQHFSNQLSGGEKQRVAIARALVNNPSVILADEPTGNLDSRSGTQVLRILQQLHAQGKTIILVTHEKGTAEHAERIVYLRDGHIERDEPVVHRRMAELGAEIK